MFGAIRVNSASKPIQEQLIDDVRPFLLSPVTAIEHMNGQVADQRLHTFDVPGVDHHVITGTDK